MGARPRSPTGKGTFWGNIFGHAQTCNQSAYSTYSALLARDSTCSTAVDKLNVFRKAAAAMRPLATSTVATFFNCYY